MMASDWDDAYHELWRYAAHHRGLREALGELHGHALFQGVRQWPRTCGADALAIAAVIDPVLRAAPLETGGHGIARRWRRCAHRLADGALREPMREYRHNREFWAALASVASFLASIDEPVPEAMWERLLADVSEREPTPRNAIVADNALHVVAYSYDELWQAQKQELARIRGADQRDPGPDASGTRMTVPHTTNADVLQLAAYWTHVLAHVEEQRREMGPDGPIALHAAGIDGEIMRWRAVLRDVDTYAAHGSPSALYAKNEAFWRASASLAVTVAVIDEAPPPFDLLLDGAIQRPNPGHRNASYPGEGTFEARWDKQHQDFIDARGFDLRDALPGRVGRPMKIPRTLNAEIVKLAADWNAAWKKLDDRRDKFIGGIPNDVGLETLKKRWADVMDDVSEGADGGKVDEVYPKNHEFWRETFELAQTLDLFNMAPTKFDIAIDEAKTLPDRFADAVGKVAFVLGDVAHKAGEGVTSGLGKPILIGGAVVLGGILLWRWTRTKPRVVEAV